MKTLNSFSTVLLSLVILTSTALAFIKKSDINTRLEIIPDIYLESQVIGNQRIETASGIPRAIYSPNYSVDASNPESMARQYLNENADILRHQSTLDNFKHIRTIETPGGVRVLFMQQAFGYPVYGGSIKVSLNRHNRVVFVMNGYQRIGDAKPAIVLSESAALDIAKNYLKISDETILETVETMIYSSNPFHSIIVYKINLVPSGSPSGDWELLVHAESGELVRVEDKANYFESMREMGTGWVFDPDPATDAGAIYGTPGFVDLLDADSDSLTSHLKEIVLENISFRNNEYLLQGPYASIVDIEAPLTGIYAQATNTYNYTRSQEEFEAVNAYYHLNESMKYLNDSLGFSIMPRQYTGGVQFDPRGLDGNNNAHYVPSTGLIAFGAPLNNVDAAEDHAIILHELGHGIHDWVTGGELSQVDGLSEGTCDYWSQSYTRSLNLYTPEDVQYDYFGLWGLQPFGAPSLRTTNFTGHYPESMIGQVHYDGQLWSSSLMSIYDQIGRTMTDRNCWEGLSMTNSISNQVDAAFAFIQADRDLYEGVNLAEIVDVFTERGYITSPGTARFTSDVNGGVGPLTVNFQDKSFSYPDPILSWQWDFDNDGVTDSEEQNPSHTYSDPGLYSVSLTIFDGTNSYTLVTTDYISVNAGILIFEGKTDEADYSGTFIADELSSSPFETVYSNRLWSSLIGYEAVFISLGNLGENGSFGTWLSQPEYTAIIDYVLSGGNIYVEGGSFMSLPQYFNYSFLNDLWTAFGVADAEFIFSINEISNLTGTFNTFASGVTFFESTQTNNFHLDQITPNENGLTSFTEVGLGNVGLQATGSSGQKVVCFSYSLANLVDGDSPHTRRDLLYRIVEYFELPFLAPSGSASQYSGHAPLEVDFSDQSYGNPDAITWAWDFDNDGNVDSELQSPQWTYTEPGTYYVQLTVGNGTVTESTELEQSIQVFDGETSLFQAGNAKGVTCEATESLNVREALTLEAWINPAAWGDLNDGGGMIIDKSYLRLFLNKSGSSSLPDSSLVLFIKHSDGTLSKTSSPANTIYLNDWQHVAVTYRSDSSDVHLYINGVDQTSIIVAPSGIVRNHAIRALKLGNNSTFSRAFEGRLDEIRIWNRALSFEEINNQKDSYLLGDESGLVAYWKMNEAWGDSLIDHSGHENHGFITNPDWAWGIDLTQPVGTDQRTFQPIEHLVLSNYPNPFNPSTTLRFGLPLDSKITLTIYDIRGKTVKIVDSGTQTAGWYEFTWMGDNGSGNTVATGVYYARLQAGSQSKVIKMLVLK